jgi:hypothetical protein
LRIGRSASGFSGKCGFTHEPHGGEILSRGMTSMAESIKSSVGVAPSPNRFLDAETVQCLLNQVPASQGGPQPLLDADGICGPLTIAAIRKFQKFQFGWQDGRVDPNNKTIGRLNAFDKDPAIGNSVRFMEFQPFDGFDPADPVRNTPPWQMVPLGGSKLVRILNANQVRKVTSNNPAIARAVFLGGVIQVFGVNRGSTIIKIRDAAGRVLARLDVTVKRKRVVRTSFFFVEDSGGNKTARSSAEVGPAITGMTAIWLPQANVEFTQRNITKPLTFKQNFGSEVRFTAHLPGVPLKEHEWDIVVAKRDFGADFNIFFVWEYEDDINPGDNADAGTLASQRSCLCDDSLTGHGLALVLAHEAGHNMGLDHDLRPGNLMGTAPTDLEKKVTKRQIDRVNP